MLKKIFLVAAIFLILLPVNIPTHAQELPTIRVSAHFTRPIVILNNNFNFTPVWHINLTNLSNERVVVNNLWLRVIGNQTLLNKLAINLMRDNEPTTEAIERLGDGNLFFEDIYTVLMPRETKELVVEIASMERIRQISLLGLAIQADGFSGFSQSSVNLNFRGRFPMLSQPIIIGR